MDEIPDMMKIKYRMIVQTIIDNKTVMLYDQLILL